MRPHPPARTERRRPRRAGIRRFLTVTGVSLTLVVTTATAALAAPPTELPGNADVLERTWQPAYDYDTDGCYPTPAIGPDGTVNGGLSPTGSLSGECHDTSDLDNTNGYSRYKCNNGWCAIAYGLYFEKDQALANSSVGGHRHDWEHVISWINQSANRVDYVSTTQHSSFQTYPSAQVRFDGSHPKVVYHKDGLSTHFFRLANTGDEPPENHYHNWRYPPIVDWTGWPSTTLRDRLMSANFGSASIKIKDGDFEYLLNLTKPSGVPFNAYA